MPEEAAHPAPEQEEAAERDQVRVHDPRERLLRETEICANRRERNPDDRRVEDDHQIPQAQDEECKPALVGHEFRALSTREACLRSVRLVDYL